MRAVLAALLALCLAAAAAAAEPQPEPGAHDPTLLIQGDRWFVFTTGQGLQRLASSDQGKTWQRLAPVFTQPPAWWLEAVPEHQGVDVWAPKLFEHRGRVWALYSISTFGKNRSAIGLVSSDKADGSEWRDDGLVVQSVATDNFNAIDPDLFVDTDGKLWLSYGSFWDGLRLTQLDAATLKPIGETRFIARNKPGIEAPTMARHGEWVYLFASYDLCCKGADSTYNVRVGRARSVEGPYLDRDGKALLDGGGTPLLTGGTRWKGPGHQDVAGDWFVHHAYDTQRGGKPHLRLKRLSWSTDGWPVIAQEE